MAYLGNDTRKIYFDDIDVTEWCLKIPDTPLLKTDWGTIPSLSNMNLLFRTDDKAFDLSHKASIFFGEKLTDFKVRITEFDADIWEGNLIDAKTNVAQHKINIIGESKLQNQLNLSARLDSNLVNPATAIKNILILHEVDIHYPSFSFAEQILDDIPTLVQVNPDVLESTANLGEILQLLANAAIGRFYLTENGAIGFDTFFVDTSPVITTTLDDLDFLQYPLVENESNDIIDGYSIKYAYDESTLNIELGNNIKTLDFGIESLVSVMDLGTATYIGNQWIKLSARDYTRYTLYVPKELKLALDMDYRWITINSAVLGIENKDAEIIGLDNSDSRWLKISCRIVK